MGVLEMCARRIFFKPARDPKQEKKGGECIAGTPGNAFIAERRPPISPI